MTSAIATTTPRAPKLPFSEADVTALHQRFAAMGDNADWYGHLVSAALDETGGDLKAALEIADEAAQVAAESPEQDRDGMAALFTDPQAAGTADQTAVAQYARRKEAAGQQHFGWSEEDHPRESSAHDGKRPGEFAPAKDGGSNGKQEHKQEQKQEQKHTLDLSGTTYSRSGMKQPPPSADHLYSLLAQLPADSSAAHPGSTIAHIDEHDFPQPYRSKKIIGVYYRDPAGTLRKDSITISHDGKASVVRSKAASMHPGQRADEPLQMPPANERSQPQAGAKEQAAQFGKAGDKHHLAGLDKEQQKKKLAEYAGRIQNNFEADPAGLLKDGPPKDLDLSTFEDDLRGVIGRHTQKTTVAPPMEKVYEAVGKKYGLSKHDFQRAVAHLTDQGKLRPVGANAINQALDRGETDPELVLPTRSGLNHHLWLPSADIADYDKIAQQASRGDPSLIGMSTESRKTYPISDAKGSHNAPVYSPTEAVAHPDANALLQTVQRAYNDPAQKRLGLSGQLSHIWNAVKQAHPDVTEEQFHKQLMQWQKDGVLMTQRSDHSGGVHQDNAGRYWEETPGGRPRLVGSVFLSDEHGHVPRVQQYSRTDLADRIEQAANDTDTDPTEGQVAAGNYRKGHVTVNGIPITIENPRGSIRRGTGADGKLWQVTMGDHYGYIRLTESEADGDQIDVFIGPDPESELVFVVDQIDQDTGDFDELKVMVGFHNRTDARRAYLANYTTGWRCGPITALTLPAFKEWVEHGDTGKPLSDQVDGVGVVQYAKGGVIRRDKHGHFAKFGSTVSSRASDSNKESSERSSVHSEPKLRTIPLFVWGTLTDPAVRRTALRISGRDSNQDGATSDDCTEIEQVQAGDYDNHAGQANNPAEFSQVSKESESCPNIPMYINRNTKGNLDKSPSATPQSAISTDIPYREATLPGWRRINSDGTPRNPLGAGHERSDRSPDSADAAPDSADAGPDDHNSDTSYYDITPDATGSLAGQVLDLTPAQLRRLIEWEGDTYTLVPVVLDDGGQALAFRRKPAADVEDERRAELLADLLLTSYGDRAEEAMEAVLGSGSGNDETGRRVAQYDRSASSQASLFDWDPHEHPRDDSGHFAKKGSGSVVIGVKEKVKAASQHAEQHKAGKGGKGGKLATEHHQALHDLFTHSNALTNDQLADVIAEHPANMSGETAKSIKPKLVERIKGKLGQARKTKQQQAEEGSWGLFDQPGQQGQPGQTETPSDYTPANAGGPARPQHPGRTPAGIGSRGWDAIADAKKERAEKDKDDRENLTSDDIKDLVAKSVKGYEEEFGNKKNKGEDKADTDADTPPDLPDPHFTGTLTDSLEREYYFVDGKRVAGPEEVKAAQATEKNEELDAIPETKLEESANVEPEHSTGDDGGTPGRRPNLGGTDSGSAGGDGSAKQRVRIVTAREHLVKPADPTLIPESIRKHLSEYGVQGAASAIRAMEVHGGFLLADGTGAGKTRQQLAVAATAAQKGKKVLMVTPAEVIKPDWKKEKVTGSFADDSATMGLSLVLNKGDKQLSAGEIHLTTYDQLSKIKSQVDKNTVLIFDESHSLKNWGSARAKHGHEMAKAASQVMYATATPADKPLHIAHLFRAKVFGDRSWEETYWELGLRQVDVHTGGGNYVKQWQINPAVGSAEVYRRMSGLFDRMIEDGLMLKREISLDGLQVQGELVSLPAEAKVEVNQVFSDKLRETDGNKAVALMAARMAQEVHKIPHTVKAVQEELAEGRSVIVFAARVNKSGEKEGEEDSGTEGTMKLLREALEQAGVPTEQITELHGGATKTAAQKAKAMQVFQSGSARVMLATIESGGTGVNLDDTVGDRPRTTVVITPPFSAVSHVQLAGRTWRLNTKSDTKIRHLFADTEIDRWNAALVARKMKVHGAVVAGEAMRLSVPRDGEEPELEIGGEHHSPYHWRPLVRVQQATTATKDGGEKISISGDTFTHKDRLKKAGARWDADTKLWTISKDKVDSLRELVGLRFSDQPARQETPATESPAEPAPTPEPAPAVLAPTPEPPAEAPKKPVTTAATTPPPITIKKVNTSRGERYVHGFSPSDQSFWKVWKSDKPDYLTVRKDNYGRWTASIWGETEDEIQANLADLKKRGVRGLPEVGQYGYVPAVIQLGVAGYRDEFDYAASILQYEVQHAPAGGVSIGGKEYKGGEFIPAEVMDNATDEEKAMIQDAAANMDRLRKIVSQALESEGTYRGAARDVASQLNIPFNSAMAKYLHSDTDIGRPNQGLTDASRPELTLAEKAAVYEYVWAGDDLNDGDLSGALEKAGKFPEPVKAYRGLDFEDEEDFEAFVQELEAAQDSDDTVLWSRPTSTAIAAGSVFAGNVQLTIRANRGLDASFYAGNTGELLLPANSEFRVLSVKRIGRKLQAELEQV